MATFVPAPRVCRYVVAWKATGNDEEFHNVLEVGKTSEWPDGGGAMDTVGERIAAWIIDTALPLIGASVSIQSLTAQRMLAYAEPIYDQSSGDWPDDGGDAADILPLNTCVELKKATGATGRSRRGFAFISGIPKDKVDTSDNNHMTSAYQTSWSAAGADLLGKIASTDVGAQLAVVSRFHKVGDTPSVPRDEAVFNTVQDLSVTRSRFATRRKRMFN